MRFPRQEYWSRLPFPSPGYLPDPGMEPASSALQADSLPSEPPEKPFINAHHDNLVTICHHTRLLQYCWPCPHAVHFIPTIHYLFTSADPQEFIQNSCFSNNDNNINIKVLKNILKIFGNSVVPLTK